jgi:Protein of unknown function (DUF3300)
MLGMRTKNVLLASACLLFVCLQPGCADQPPQDSSAPDNEFTEAPTAAERATEVFAPSPDELDQLVAPIALYPDKLVGQILAASTYPTQIVEANRWVQQNSALKGDALAKSVDTQPWDPSVKALTQFPQVLDMMDKNLSWTSALGQAYTDGSQPVLDAVQVMRHRAQQAGTLASSPPIRVSSTCRCLIPGSLTASRSACFPTGITSPASSSTVPDSSTAR